MLQISAQRIQSAQKNLTRKSSQGYLPAFKRFNIPTQSALKQKRPTLARSRSGQRNMSLDKNDGRLDYYGPLSVHTRGRTKYT